MEGYFWILPLLIFPDFNLGLLSDYKICGDSACETPMSRVEAIKNYQGKDCRFLNFRRGDAIIVYHKLKGKREDLWAGSIDKQFGYFPKDAVKEEEVFSTTRKVVETQKSDFFCMDESGYPVDTSHLDSDEADDKNFQIQEAESIKFSPQFLDANTQGSLTSTDSMVKEKKDEDGKKDPISAEHLENEFRNSAPPEEQGGSPSSNWLHSSVTGWLGFAKEEQSGDLEQDVREDEREQTKSGASLTSSVTGWLGFGDEQKPNNDEDGENMKEESFTSTITGWVGLGEKKETVTVENDEQVEMDNEQEPTERFRSRRMSLDLEGSKLHEEEKEDMGTLGWLSSGLSSRLGLGSGSQDSGGEGGGGEEQLVSSSWLEMKIGGIWGIGDSNNGDDGSKGSNIRETEKDQTLEQPSGSENVDFSQSQASVSDEIKAETEEESHIKEVVNIPTTLPGSGESGKAVEDNVDNSDTKETNNSDINSGIQVFNNHDLIHNFSQINDKNMDKLSTRGHQITQNDEFIEQAEINLDPGPILHLNSMEQPEGNMEEEEIQQIHTEFPRSFKEEGTEEPNQVHNSGRSTIMPENSPVSGDEDKQYNRETSLSKQEILEAQSEESPEKTQVGGDQEESIKQNQLPFSTLETEIYQREPGLQEEIKPIQASPQNDGPVLSGNSQSLHKNVSKDDAGKASSNETTPNISKTQESLQIKNNFMLTETDVDRFKKTPEDQNELNEKETSNFEEQALHEIKENSLVGSEKQREATEENEKVNNKKQEDVNNVKEENVEVRQEGQQTKLEDINKIETEMKNKMVNVSGEVLGLKSKIQSEKEEMEVGEKQEAVLPELEKARGERSKESEEANEKELEKIVEDSWESTSKEGMELRDKSQNNVEKLKEEFKQVEELVEHGNRTIVKEVKESEEPKEKELEKMDDDSGESTCEKEMKFREKRQSGMETIKQEFKQAEELREHANQNRVEELKESEEQNKKEEMANISEEMEVKTELNNETQREVQELNKEGNQQKESLEHEQAKLETLEESVESKRQKEEEQEPVGLGESNSKEGKRVEEKRLDEDDEPREEGKSVKELVEHGNQGRLEELKESEEQNEKENSDISGERKGKMELKEETQKEMEDIMEERDQQVVFLKHEQATSEETVWRSEMKNLETETLDNSRFVSVASETKTQTEIQKGKEEEGAVEIRNKAELEKAKEHQTKDVEIDNVDLDDSRKKDRQDSGLEEEIRKTEAIKTGNEFPTVRGGEEINNSAKSQDQTSEQSKSTNSHQRTETESRGAFGLFKSTFGFFSPTPSPVMSDSTQSVRIFNTNSAQTSQPFNPELDSPTESFHADGKPTAFPTEEPQPYPISAENNPQTAPLFPKASSKTQTPTKQYTNLLHYMSAGEAVILQELLGRHKLQYLNYILTSSEAVSADEDQSILSDIKRLVQHHMDTFIVPSMSITEAPQEDKKRTSAIIALQKLKMLLKTVKETISTGISDVSNHQAEHNPSQEKKDYSQMDSLHKDDDGKPENWNNVEEERRDEESEENVSSIHLTHLNSQHNTMRVPGLIKQNLEFVQRVAEDSLNYAHTATEILFWIIVQLSNWLDPDFALNAGGQVGFYVYTL